MLNDLTFWLSWLWHLGCHGIPPPWKKATKPHLALHGLKNIYNHFLPDLWGEDEMDEHFIAEVHFVMLIFVCDVQCDFSLKYCVCVCFGQAGNMLKQPFSGLLKAASSSSPSSQQPWNLNVAWLDLWCQWLVISFDKCSMEVYTHWVKIILFAMWYCTPFATQAWRKRYSDNQHGQNMLKHLVWLTMVDLLLMFNYSSVGCFIDLVPPKKN